jgi:UDP-N-acetyl-D-mannosaminuronate dehydrogenase
MNLALKNIYSFAKISFAGLGNMGFPMAINLARIGN